MEVTRARDRLMENLEAADGGVEGGQRRKGVRREGRGGGGEGGR